MTDDVRRDPSPIPPTASSPVASVSSDKAPPRDGIRGPYVVLGLAICVILGFGTAVFFIVKKAGTLEAHAGDLSRIDAQDNPGEPIATPALPKGTLTVELTPAVDGVRLPEGATIALSAGEERYWDEETIARFDELENGVDYRLSAKGDVLAPELAVAFPTPTIGMRIALPAVRIESSTSAVEPPPRWLRVDARGEGSTVAWIIDGEETAAQPGPATPETMTEETQQRLGEFFGQSWDAHGIHKDAADDQVDYARVIVDASVSYSEVYALLVGLTSPRRKADWDEGKGTVRTFAVEVVSAP